MWPSILTSRSSYSSPPHLPRSSHVTPSTRRKQRMKTLRGTVMIIALASTSAFAPQARAQGVPIFDHLKCYKVKEVHKKQVKGLVDLTPSEAQLLKESNCKISGP